MRTTFLLRLAFLTLPIAFSVTSLAGCSNPHAESEKLCLDDKGAPAVKRLDACSGVCGAKDRYPDKITRGPESCRMVEMLKKEHCFDKIKTGELDEGDAKEACAWVCSKGDDKGCPGTKGMKAREEAEAEAD